MDRGPWTTPMDRVHGPPHGPGPGPWTTPNFQKEIAPVNFIWKFTEGQGMKNTDSYLLLTFLRVCLVKASCFGIAAPWMGRPQTRFEIQKIQCISTPNIFIPTLSNCYSIRKTPIPPSTPRLLDSTVHENEPIYFINEVYPKSTNL